MIVFKYRREKGRLGQSVKRPVALVNFQNSQHQWVSQNLYIDSGADITLIPLSMGKLLGFEISPEESLREIGGISSTIPVVSRNLRIKIGEKELEIEAAWALSEEVPPLLGRKDVFDAFEVIFNQQKETISFREIA